MRPEHNIKKKEQQRRYWLIFNIHTLLDLLLTSGCFVGAYYTKKYFLPQYIKGLSIYPNYYIVLLLISIIWFISFRLIKLQKNLRLKTYSGLFFDIIKSTSLGMFILIALLFIFNIQDVSRILLGLFYVFNIAILVITKFMLFSIANRYRKVNHNITNVLIIGTKSRAEAVINLINSATKPYNVIGCVDLDKSQVGNTLKNKCNVIGSIEDVQDIIIKEVVDEIIFAMPLKMIDSVDAYIFLFELMGINVRIFPDWQIHSILYNPGIASLNYDEFNGIPSLLLATTSSRHHDLLIKTAFDFFFSGFALLLSAPFFIVISLIIKLTSKGPIFFKQERIGLNGRKFMVYKFRTMVLDAEDKLKELMAKNEADGPAFKIKKDPRIIPLVGTLLRKTSLDELPQLLNVLKGEMSLVGPRPPLQSEVIQYNIWQRRRLSMKPGITCTWQIQPDRNDLSFNQWMNLDLHYIDNWNLSLDFKILYKTLTVVFAAHGN